MTSLPDWFFHYACGKRRYRTGTDFISRLTSTLFETYPLSPFPGEGGNCDPLAVSWFAPPLPPGEGAGGRGLRGLG